MSEQTKKKTVKKKSQVPMAVVYFGTMLLFLAVFGLIASFLVNRINELNQPKPEQPAPKAPSFNIMFARVNSKNVLSDMSIMRFSPETNTVVVIPVSSFTVDSDDSGNTLRNIYDDKGVNGLKNAVEANFGLTVDNYVTVSNDAFDQVADLFGGIVYTPKEELYYLSENDEDDISFRKDQTVSLVGRQIRLIFQYPVFSEGKSGNLTFMGEALNQIVKNAFRQTSITKNNLDNIYNIITNNSDTDLDKNVFKTQKTYIKQMLDTNAVNCKVLVPSGAWEDDAMKMSGEFKKQLKNVIDETDAEPSQSSKAASAESKK